MKTKTLLFITISSSIISGILGSYIFISIFEGVTSKDLTHKQKNNNNNEIVKLNSLETETIAIVENVSPSIVSIILKKDLLIYKSDPWGFFRQPFSNIKEKVGGGTGFIITKDGKILTNKHVASEKESVYTIITNSGDEYDAMILGIDPVNDLAVLEIINSTNEFIPLVLKDEKDPLKVGQFTLAIGNALSEFQNSVSLGIISGVNRSIESEQGKLTGLIQTDTAINPGNSGGPLINLNGKVIGINTSIINSVEGIGFAILISREKVIYILDSIRRFGKIKRPYIGISYIPVSEGIKDKLGLKVNYGVYIIDEKGSIASGSSAEKAGIEPGDLITKIDGKKITAKEDINNIIQNKIPGTKIKLDVIKKNGTSKELELVLGEY